MKTLQRVRKIGTGVPVEIASLDMATLGTVFGCIFCRVGSASHPEFSARTRRNEAAIQALPQTDSYPALTRNMFSVTSTSYTDPGLYKVQTIPFGLSLKDAHEEWDLWLLKLEALLVTLDWERAEFHLELETAPKEGSSTRFDYRWEVPVEGSPEATQSWARLGTLPYSASRERCTAWVTTGEQELRERPTDVELMERLYHAYRRTGAHAMARSLRDQLTKLDPVRARRLQS